MSKFNDMVSITTTFESSIIKVDEDISTCPAPKAPRKSNIVSLVSPVMAVKQFVCTYKYLNCKIDVDLQSWTKIIAHLKYEDIDSLFPHVLKILHMIWANANSLPQHCVGGRGSKHHALKTAKAYMCVALNTS